MSFKSVDETILGEFWLQLSVGSCNREHMKDAEKPSAWEAAEILEALRDTTNPKRGSLDRNMLARKGAFFGNQPGRLRTGIIAKNQAENLTAWPKASFSAPQSASRSSYRTSTS